MARRFDYTAEPPKPVRKKYVRKPEWIRMNLLTNESYNSVKKEITSTGLHTVCQEARCPNIHECWGEHKTATYMILGDTCTRRCRFCAVKTGVPDAPDEEEPLKVAASIEKMGIKHAVITMVNRDDMEDGGAAILAETVRRIHELSPPPTVEILSSDLMGRKESIRVLVESCPEITSHNLETVRRLTPKIRSRSTYERSLDFLSLVKEIDSGMMTKSSLMLGLGEEFDEILEAMDDLRGRNVDILNLGQYLQPGRTNAPVEKYWTPDEFLRLKDEALSRGFLHCESGPMVRSSYHAGAQLNEILSRKQK